MRMDMVQHMRTDMRQELRLAPQIIQSIEILQLPIMELVQEIKTQLQENPVLEEVAAAETQPETTDAPEEPKVKTEAEQAEQHELDDPRFDNSWDFDPPRRRGSEDDSDRKSEAMNNTASRSKTLQEHLFEQFVLLEVDSEALEIGEAIIFNLNDDGFLQYPLEDIIALLQPPVTLQRAEEVLQLIQKMDPPGIAARNLQECLLLQLGDTEAYEFERLLVRGHLEDIEKNKLPKICKDTGRTMDDVKASITFIAHLDPRPGRLFSRDEPHYIIPDISVSEVDGEYVVTVDDKLLPTLEINARYRQMMRQHPDKTAREFIRGKIEAAKWLIDSIQQRRQTIRRVAEAIVRHQQAFFEQGVSALKPLKMQDIADELGIHVSTVSRAVGGKYMQTPQGIYALKYFFTGGMQTEEIGGDGGGDGSMSILAVQQRVKQLIESEDRHSPLSDDDIMNQLKAEGLQIARRTITKYRKAMRIPSSRQRREY